jgi:hypothetical protein
VSFTVVVVVDDDDDDDDKDHEHEQDDSGVFSSDIVDPSSALVEDEYDDFDRDNDDKIAKSTLSSVKIYLAWPHRVVAEEKGNGSEMGNDDTMITPLDLYDNVLEMIWCLLVKYTIKPLKYSGRRRCRRRRRSIGVELKDDLAITNSGLDVLKMTKIAKDNNRHLFKYVCVRIGQSLKSISKSNKQHTIIESDLPFNCSSIIHEFSRTVETTRRHHNGRDANTSSTLMMVSFMCLGNFRNIVYFHPRKKSALYCRYVHKLSRHERVDRTLKNELFAKVLEIRSHKKEEEEEEEDNIRIPPIVSFWHQHLH